MDLKGRVLAEVERSNKERPKKESRHNEGVVCEVQMCRLTYCGQVTLLHGYAHGHRQRGRPTKRRLDIIHEDCKDLNPTIHEASRIAADRTKWNKDV